MNSHGARLYEPQQLSNPMRITLLNYASGLFTLLRVTDPRSVTSLKMRPNIFGE
jgi:hypothetical protein